MQPYLFLPNTRVAPDIRPFLISGIRPDIRLAGYPTRKLYLNEKQKKIRLQQNIYYLTIQPDVRPDWIPSRILDIRPIQYQAQPYYLHLVLVISVPLGGACTAQHRAGDRLPLAAPPPGSGDLSGRRGCHAHLHLHTLQPYPARLVPLLYYILYPF